MDNRYIKDMLRTPPSLDNYSWPSSSTGESSNLFAKQRSLWPPLSANLNSLMSTKTKHRRSHYGGRGMGYHYNRDSSDYRNFRQHYFQHQFSDDSGFSSCGSSASSIADDIDSIPGPAPLAIKPITLRSRSTCRRTLYSSSHIMLQSGTVASVLAAGVSDSEETDHCNSDDEHWSDAFLSCKKVHSANQSTTNKISLENPLFSASHIEQLPQKENVQLQHSGRDVLDLGTNLVTKFPMRATKLPEMNLPLFLNNRSQYHRLGKFGTTETLCFASCMKQCGFSFPVPPSEA